MTLRSAFGMMALAALCTHCSATVTTLGQECGEAIGEAGGAETQLELTTGGAPEGSGGTTAVESTSSENVEDSTGGTSFGGTSFGAGGTSTIATSPATGGTKPTSSRAATGGTSASTTSTARVVRVQIATLNHLRPSIVLYFDNETTVVVTVGNYTDALDPRICPCKTGERCVSDYIGANLRAESWWGYCVPATFTCQSSSSTDPVAGISSTATVCE